VYVDVAVDRCAEAGDVQLRTLRRTATDNRSSPSQSHRFPVVAVNYVKDGRPKDGEKKQEHFVLGNQLTDPHDQHRMRYDQA